MEHSRARGTCRLFGSEHIRTFRCCQRYRCSYRRHYAYNIVHISYYSIAYRTFGHHRDADGHTFCLLEPGWTHIAFTLASYSVLSGYVS